MTEETQELSQLLEQIKIQGNKVRELKETNAEKSLISSEVAKLLSLKAQLPPSEESKKSKPKKVDERAAKKEARRLAREAKAKQAVKCPIVKDMETESYGELPLLQAKRTKRTFVEVQSVQSSLNQDKPIWVRGYVHTVRSQSKLTFLLVRQKSSTVQAVVSSKEISKFVSTHVYTESVIDILATVTKTPSPTNAVVSDVELQVSKLFIVSKATPQLPFQVFDASRTEQELAKDDNLVKVHLDTRLDHRTLDLRTPLSQAICRVTTEVLHSFRSFLYDAQFLEICSPKLLGGASEGGSEVFTTSYFSQTACLAQSPQLHKQMSCACSGLERVFEVGPVFRAENSNTNRHLCEFTGLDVEMAISDHYHEVLDLFSDLFHFMFTSINSKCAKEVEIIRHFHPFENLVFEPPLWVDESKISGVKARTLRIEFKEAIAMLREAGVDEEEQPEFDDLSTPVEKKLGELVKEKYGVDFYFLDKFPLAPRPFYTMPCPEDERLSNSYDFFIRGQEIMSGAQRVHDWRMLEKRIEEMEIPVESLRFYIDAFKQGALPHGGGGVGLERVVMLFLALPNIRLVRMFPRDPQRLMP